MLREWTLPPIGKLQAPHFAPVTPYQLIFSLPYMYVRFPAVGSQEPRTSSCLFLKG